MKNKKIKLINITVLSMFAVATATTGVISQSNKEVKKSALVLNNLNTAIIYKNTNIEDLNLYNTHVNSIVNTTNVKPIIDLRMSIHNKRYDIQELSKLLLSKNKNLITMLGFDEKEVELDQTSFKNIIKIENKKMIVALKTKTGFEFSDGTITKEFEFSFKGLQKISRRAIIVRNPFFETKITGVNGKAIFKIPTPSISTIVNVELNGKAVPKAKMEIEDLKNKDVITLIIKSNNSQNIIEQDGKPVKQARFTYVVSGLGKEIVVENPFKESKFNGQNKKGHILKINGIQHASIKFAINGKDIDRKELKNLSNGDEITAKVEPDKTFAIHGQNNFSIIVNGLTKEDTSGAKSISGEVMVYTFIGIASTLLFVIITLLFARGRNK
ncbi:hypothetical protein MYMA111404_02780 [Mycoplasma marinum]|uniref:Uncharacterized protein n=1 Tax=Mycoplasma marinum TaxID=1937190 RepID=A0A4R0XR12_9MOLU|nr:hypothetical protein [Mycoplasma marinum]TCG10820.1 hypothetical protein C4B24_03770 [Mycoplasma marinum]